MIEITVDPDAVPPTDTGAMQERDRIVELLELLHADRAETAKSLGEARHYAIAASAEAGAHALKIALHYVKDGRGPRCWHCGSIQWVLTDSRCAHCGRALKK